MYDKTHIEETKLKIKNILLKSISNKKKFS